MKRLTTILMVCLAACRAQDAQPVQPAPAPAGAPAPADPQHQPGPYYAADWARFPVGFKAVQFAQTHRVADCLLDFAASTTSASDGTLFLDDTTTAVFHVVHGDRFHVHTVFEDGRDEVLVPDKEGELVLEPRKELPKAFVLCTAAFYLDGGGRRLFVPPYTVSYRVEPLAKMQALLSVQEFAVHIADEKGADPHTVIAALPRNWNEFTFGYYNLTQDRRNALTAAYLCAPSADHVIPEPTYRAAVKNKDGRVFQKVEVLPYPPSAAAAPQGADFYEFEHDGRAVDKIAVPPRPVLTFPDTTKQALPFINVTAHLYGFGSGRYSLSTSQGFPKAEEAAWIAVDTKEIGPETKTVTTTISPDKNSKGEAFERTAFYGLRLSRSWASKGGHCPPRDIRVSRPDPHDHRFFVMTDKLPHVTMFNLAGTAAPAAEGGPGFGTLGLLALNDAAVVSAVGGRPLMGAPANPSMTNLGDRVNVTVVNNHGFGGGGGGTSTNGGGMLDGKPPVYLNTGTLSVPYGGGQLQGQGGPAGGAVQPVGWQNRFNQPKGP